MAVETMTEALDAPLVRQGDTLAAEVDALRVVDDATFQRAAGLRVRLATWLKEAHAFFDPMCDSTYKAWKTTTERRKSVIEPRETGYRALGDRMGEYEQEQERLRQVAETAAQRERERLEAVALAEAEAEQARLTTEAEDAAIEAAIAAAEAGDTQAAERIVAAPVVVPTVQPAPVVVAPVQIAAPVAAGYSSHPTWSARLDSLPDLVRAAAAGNSVALSCLSFDQVRANGLARSLRNNLKVPGVTAVEKRTTATRTA